LRPFDNFPGVIRVEQLSASTMMLEEAQFTEILVHQNGLNQPSVANLPIHFVLGISGPCNKLHNNPRHVIDTSDSQLDLERAMNDDLNEL